MRLCLSVDEFCNANSISRWKFYELLKSGAGPAVMKLGRKTLISIEAAEAWRRTVEANSAEAIAQCRQRARDSAEVRRLKGAEPAGR